MPCAPLSRRRHKHIRWRRRRHTSPAQRYYITPEGGALNPPVRRSRSQAEPLAPRAKGPAAPSTLTPVRACQPSGILESTAQVPIPTAPQAPEPSSPGSQPSCQPHINIFKFLVVFFRKISYNDMRNVSYMGSPQGMRFSFMQKKESLLFHERI